MRFSEMTLFNPDQVVRIEIERGRLMKEWSVEDVKKKKGIPLIKRIMGKGGEEETERLIVLGNNLDRLTQEEFVKRFGKFFVIDGVDILKRAHITFCYSNGQKDTKWFDTDSEMFDWVESAGLVEFLRDKMKVLEQHE